MLTSDYDIYICTKYSGKDEQGNSHCNQCPLAVNQFMCKAVAHYDEKINKWVYDEHYWVLKNEE